MGRVKELMLEQELADDLSKEMQQEIDQEIMFAMLQDAGWHLIALERLLSMKHAVDIDEWLKTNCTSEAFRWGRKCLFKKQEDAVMFALKWS